MLYCNDFYDYYNLDKMLKSEMIKKNEGDRYYVAGSFVKKMFWEKIKTRNQRRRFNKH